jgi:hypothetical protein
MPAEAPSNFQMLDDVRVTGTVPSDPFCHPFDIALIRLPETIAV